MRRFLPALAALPLALWGCDGRSATPSGTAPAVPAAVLASEDAQRQGRELYLQHCALCHGEQADGRGVRHNLSGRARDFTSTTWREGTSPAEVYLVIREGRRGTAMAGWKIFDEDQTWQLVAYLLSVAESSG